MRHSEYIATATGKTEKDKHGLNLPLVSRRRSDEIQARYRRYTHELQTMLNWEESKSLIMNH
jgi:hypothetical protein